MIYAYGITLQGTYHIKNNIVCQDAHKIIKCNNDMVIAAVADGLGSEDHSEVASKIAVDISTSYCKENVVTATTTNEILDIIKTSFSEAQRAIETESRTQGYELTQCDTTLTLAVVINDVLYYGHSGDSGIVVLTSDGLYKKVTEQQRDDDNNVFPLFFKDRWIFKEFDKKVCSVFLATDGMLETLFPFLVRNEPVNIHINLARFFMDNRKLCIDKDGESAVQARIEDFVKNIPDEQVNDDKTIVVLVNTSVESRLQPDDYYAEPDWVELKRKRDKEWKRMAYPHLFKDKTSDKIQEETSTDNSEDSTETNSSHDNMNDTVAGDASDKKDIGNKEETSQNKKGWIKGLFKNS